MGSRVWGSTFGWRVLPFEGLKTFWSLIASYVHTARFPIVLKDVKRGYTCRQISVSDHRDKYERARELVAQAQVKYGYVGWSNEIDRTYDPYATFFIVEDQAGEIVATTRLVHRRDSLVALERGFKRDGSQYSLAEENCLVADLNSFYFKKGHQDSLMLLFTTMSRYGILAGIKRAFCMLDKDNKFIERLYLGAGFRFSRRFQDPIAFPTYHKKIDREAGPEKDNLQPAYWTIMEMEKASILKMAFLSLRYQTES